jgi:hypothetical protein
MLHEGRARPLRITKNCSNRLSLQSQSVIRKFQVLRFLRDTSLGTTGISQSFIYPPNSNQLNPDHGVLLEPGLESTESWWHASGNPNPSVSESVPEDDQLVLLPQDSSLSTLRSLICSNQSSTTPQVGNETNMKTKAALLTSCQNKDAYSSVPPFSARRHARGATQWTCSVYKLAATPTDGA